MLPKTGKVLPPQGGDSGRRLPYAAAVAAALQRELGDTHRAIKIVMRWTGASDRSARTWINGLGSPSGYHLLRLARECDAVFEVVLDLTDRQEAKLGVDLHAAEVAIARAMGAFETLRRQRSTPGSARHRV
jgi:hypothetical protein